MEPSTSAEAAAAAAAGGPDPRLELMGSFVIKSLKLKPEKWTRVVTVEEHKGIIKEFLDRNTPVVLIIILTPAAQLVPSTTFPLSQLKSKGVYFIKRYALPIPREDCGNFIIYGDLATRTIDQLSALVEEVLVPLLSNEDNYRSWPIMVAQDVQKHVHSLKSTVHQVKGQVSGETILAMPVGVEKIVKAAKELVETEQCQFDLYLKSAIEGVVIKWATQIHEVIKESPSNAFANGQNPTPHTGEYEVVVVAPRVAVLFLASSVYYLLIKFKSPHILATPTFACSYSSKSFVLLYYLFTNDILCACNMYVLLMLLS